MPVSSLGNVKRRTLNDTGFVTVYRFPFRIFPARRDSFLSVSPSFASPVGGLRRVNLHTLLKNNIFKVYKRSFCARRPYKNTQPYDRGKELVCVGEFKF